MHIERQVGDFPKGTNDWCAEGQVGNEVSVHDVDVQPLSAPSDDVFHFLSKASQVGAQDARCNDDAHGEAASSPRLTTRATAVPRGRPIPAAGRVARTTPASRPPAVESTAPTRTPAPVRIFLAWGT